jgi:hypothetical protein
MAGVTDPEVVPGAMQAVVKPPRLAASFGTVEASCVPGLTVGRADLAHMGKTAHSGYAFGAAETERSEGVYVGGGPEAREQRRSGRDALPSACRQRQPRSNWMMPRG